jgi:biofilm PGA synthesis N-glycosyltransferase PgaC
MARKRLCEESQKKRGIYLTVLAKFLLAQLFSLTWVGISIYLSYPWFLDLSRVVGDIPAFIIIMFIAYVPGYLVSFTTISLILDRQPPFKVCNPDAPVTILIAARNEEKNIADCIKYVSKQEYDGEITVLLVDNGSTDRTVEVAREAAEKYGVKLEVVREEKPGKAIALNTGLNHIKTDLFATLDADTLLHRLAIKHIVARILSSPQDVCAVAGHVLARNSRDGLLARIQEWDYFIGIASIKRMQGLYQGTLVAQGAFSLYKTEAVRRAGGWPNTIGEDIVLTWKLFEQGCRVYFEPLAVVFTMVPTKMKDFQRQRSRWARGMIEGLKISPPFQHKTWYGIFLSALDYLIPFVDFFYTFAWIPGLILAVFFQKYYIVGLYTIFVVPLNLIVLLIMASYQKNVFDALELHVRKNRAGFYLYFLFYQMIHSPISVWGYIQELLGLERKWK